MPIWDEPVTPPPTRGPIWDEPTPATPAPTPPKRGAIGQALDATLGRYSRAMTGAIQEGVFGSPEAPLPGGQYVGGALPSMLSRLISPIPETGAQLLAMLLTGGAGKLTAGAGPVVQAAARTGAAAGGGALGAQLEGESPGRAALTSGGATGVLEAAVPLVGKIIRSLPGMKQRIADQEAAGVGAALGTASPPLAGATTSETLRELAAGRGQQALSGAKESVIQDLEQQLGGAKLVVPSLNPPVTTAPALAHPWGAGPSSRPIDLRAANQALSDIGAQPKAQFAVNPLDRSVRGVPPRRFYGEVRGDIQSALAKIDPALAARWDAAQGVHERGLAALRLLQRPGAFRYSTQRLAPGPGGMTDAAEQILRGQGGAPQIPALLLRTPLPNLGSRYGVEPGVQLNTPYLQKLIQTPKGQAWLRDKLGDPAFEQLRAALFRPTPFRPSQSTQTLIDVFSQPAVGATLGPGGQ